LKVEFESVLAIIRGVWNKMGRVWRNESNLALSCWVEENLRKILHTRVRVSRLG